MKNDKVTISNKLKKYIGKYYIGVANISYSKRITFSKKPLDSNTFLVDESFNIKLFELIDSSGKSDVEIYKKAGIDRRHFSKIKSSNDYVPQKKTIVAFIIALELPLKEAKLLLNSAGFSLSNSYLFDVIVKFFITEKIYNITLINECLLDYDQPLIGY